MPSLDEYTGVLGRRLAKHLLRRATFNFSKEKVDELAVLTPAQAFAILEIPSTNDLAYPIDPEESDADARDWTNSTELPNTFSGQGRKRTAITAWWWYNSFNKVSLKPKMSFFLHTSFTVAKDNGAGPATYFWDYTRLLDYYALGSLKTLADKITMDQSMLYYLDNNANKASNPNENYAREFLELFTILKGPQIGEGNYTNYTEGDIQQAAKVLSGFQNQTDRTVLDPDTGLPRGITNLGRHDQTSKTFSAAFGNAIINAGTDEAGMYQEHSDFVNMIFDQDATAISFVKKLYRFFVKGEWSVEVENDIIVPLAADLKASDYEVLPVLRKLFTSKHFYDLDDGDATDNTIGALVKSPLQMVCEMLSVFKIPITDPMASSDNEVPFYRDFFRRFMHNSVMGASGMSFFSPDTVAGYPAVYQGPDYDRQWFSSTSIIARYKIISSLIDGRDRIAGWGSFNEQVDPVLFVKDNISDPYSPDVIVSELADLLYCEDISEDRKTYFKGFLEYSYDADGYWAVAWAEYLGGGSYTTVFVRLEQLFTVMCNAAENQLM